MFLLLCRITSIDIKYQIWKFGVVFTDNVSKRNSFYIIKKLSESALNAVFLMHFLNIF